MIDVQVFTRDSSQKDQRALSIEEDEIKKYRKDLNDRLRIYEDDIFSRIEKLLIGAYASGGPSGLKAGTKITDDYLHGMERNQWLKVRPRNEEISKQFELFIKRLKIQRNQTEKEFKEQSEKIKAGDDLVPGVIKVVKVYLGGKTPYPGGRQTCRAAR